jgi:hypothetical protein
VKRTKLVNNLGFLGYKRLLVVYAYQFRFEILPTHKGLRLGLPLKCFSRPSRGFVGLVRVTLVSIINFPFSFSIYDFLCGFELQQ